MSDVIQAIRGMNDVLPTEIGTWQFLESTVRELVSSYGFQEMRVPVVEETRLFKRAIGELTDVVSKEMYTFTDSGGENLTLRPEATAGIARALISNGMLRGPRHKPQVTAIAVRDREQGAPFAACKRTDLRVLRWNEERTVVCLHVSAHRQIG